MSEFSEVESKISALYEMKKAIAIEVYKLCFHCGLDPDVFDYSSFGTTPNIPALSYRGQLEKRCKQMIAIVKKIEELKNA
jgi:hypothetical protein